MPTPCEDIIGDIEDLISSQDITPKERYSTRRNITVRSKRKQVTEKVLQPVILSTIIPGTQTIYVKTWGCTHNNSDSEYMAGQLTTYGYKLTENKYDADLWLLNSCTVKSPAEAHFRNEIEAGKKLGKHVVLAGYKNLFIITVIRNEKKIKHQYIYMYVTGDSVNLLVNVCTY